MEGNQHKFSHVFQNLPAVVATFALVLILPFAVFSLIFGQNDTRSKASTTPISYSAAEFGLITKNIDAAGITNYLLTLSDQRVFNLRVPMTTCPRGIPTTTPTPTLTCTPMPIIDLEPFVNTSPTLQKYVMVSGSVDFGSSYSNVPWPWPSGSTLVVSGVWNVSKLQAGVVAEGIVGSSVSMYPNQVLTFDNAECKTNCTFPLPASVLPTRFIRSSVFETQQYFGNRISITGTAYLVGDGVIFDASSVTVIDMATGAVQFSFSPPVQPSFPTATFSTDLYMNTMGHKVSAVDLNLLYSPSMLTITSVNIISNNLTQSLAGVVNDSVNGRLRLSYGAAAGRSIQSSNEAIVRIVGKVNSTGSMSLSFGPSYVTAIGSNNSVFGFGSSYQINSTAPSATPVPCASYWWIDNNSKYCQYKSFCGAYSYSGLMTFASKQACLDYPISGDADKNRKVDVFDYNYVLRNYSKTCSQVTPLWGDVTGEDCVVDSLDYAKVILNFDRSL